MITAQPKTKPNGATRGKPQRRRLPLTKIAIGAAVALVLLAVLFRIFVYAPPAAVAPVHTGVVHEAVTAEGTVQTRIEVNVGSKITGVIQHLFVDQGDAVKRGQLLATIENADVAAQVAAAQAAVRAADMTVQAATQSVAQAAANEETSRATVRVAQQNVSVAEAAVAKARADLTLAQVTYDRNDQLFKQGFVAASGMDTARDAVDDSKAGVHSSIAGTEAARQTLSADQANVVASTAGYNVARAALAQQRAQAAQAEQNLRYAQASLSYTRILAPTNGIIIQRSLEAGDTVVPGNPIVLMAATGDVWAAALIDETVVGRVHVGQPAEIRLRTGQTLKGRVERITRQADSVNRELEVDVRFVPIPRHFTLNEEVLVSIQTGQAQGLIVPFSAVVSGQNGSAAVLVAKAGRVQSVPVQVGISGAGQTLILDGVSAGDRVIIQPQAVRAGQRIHAIESSMTSQSTTSAPSGM
jgi:HlyD family secretion protein